MYTVASSSSRLVCLPKPTVELVAYFKTSIVLSLKLHAETQERLNCNKMEGAVGHTLWCPFSALLLPSIALLKENKQKTSGF